MKLRASGSECTNLASLTKHNDIYFQKNKKPIFVFLRKYIHKAVLCPEYLQPLSRMSNLLKNMQGKVTDHTLRVYGKKTPVSVTEGKHAVLHVLAAQVDKVDSVVFLENFNQSLCESAVAGSMRCTGVAVVLDSSYELSAADSVWLNGLYGETTSIYPMAKGGANKVLTPSLMKKTDSNLVCGVYEKPGFDPVTGSSKMLCFTIVNASANKLSRALTHNWTTAGMQIRDAYEDAATKKLKGKTLDQTKKVFDNLAEFTKDRNARLASEFGAIDACYTQTSNCFMRGKSGSVVYLNGAVPSAQGALTHVSPLHGFVEFPPCSERRFYPSALLSHDYVDVVALSKDQRDSIYSRAKWSGDTTVNGYALRTPITNWNAALPQPCSVYRMRFGNFGRDDRESAAIPMAKVLQMTPTAEHVEDSEMKVSYPQHVRNNLVRMQADDTSVAKLMTLRHKFNVLNPEIFDGVYLNLPRELAEKLI